MNKPTELYIIGGGRSITQGLSLGLPDKLEGKCCLTLNHSMFNYPTTCGVFCDYSHFYEKNFVKSKEPQPELMVGKFHEEMTYQKNERLYSQIRLDLHCGKVILLNPSAHIYDRTLKQGCYSHLLSGLFALSLAIYLLDVGKIFLIGFDAGCNPIDDKTKFKMYKGNKIAIADNGKVLTHAYSTFHEGQGKVGIYYNKANDVVKMFEVFRPEQQVKIYNVSQSSRIETFEKISYEQMFGLMNNERNEQRDYQNWIRESLSTLGGKI